MYPPSSPRSAGSTPAYIHPQVLPLPSSTSFSPAHPSSVLCTFAVCSLIIQRFFLSPFSSKLCASQRSHIILYTCSSSFSLTSFLSVNDVFALCIFLLLGRNFKRTISFRSMQYVYSIRYPLLFSWLFSHFSL